MKEDTLQLIVLTLFLLIYMVVGAGIFNALELRNELKWRAHFDSEFNSFAKQNNLTSAAMKTLLTTHEKACLLGYGVNGFERWDFIGSFYFTGTVLTTIGFGLTAPSTLEGQIFFIFYALIGIPINILYLNTILQKVVTMLSRLVRKGYDYIPRNKFFSPPGPKELPLGEILVASFVMFSIACLVLAMIFAFVENWTFFEAIYFIIVACSTVGFGDYVPGKIKTSVGHNVHNAYRMLNWFMISIGVVFIYVVLNLQANFFKNVLSFCISKFKNEDQGFRGPRNGRVSRMSMLSDGEGQDLGSFAAIQVALDRLKTQAETSATGDSTELTALSNIEKLLKSEYFKVQAMQGNSAKAKWKRAANRTRVFSPTSQQQQTRQVNGIVTAQQTKTLSAKDAKVIDSYEDLPGAVLDAEMK
eukprot:gene20093-22063_t